MSGGNSPMDVPVDKSLPQLANSGDTRWITATVALFAMAVFVISGAQVVPYLVSAVDNGAAPPPELATAFVLNIALLLLAWRRSVQLKASFAQQRAAELRIRHLAYHDEVTGLHNRRHLHVIAGEMLESGEKDVALLLLDLDQFKGVNDIHGHEAGDAVLMSTADKLRACCEQDDCSVRLGGDEFAVLLRGSRARGKKPRQLADRLLEEFARPMPLADTATNVGASIGIAGMQ